MNMKKWIAAALACSALALSACGGQSKDASSSAPKADKVYRVAANAEFAPFESLDSAGNVEGFDIDLMNAMAKTGNVINIKKRRIRLRDMRLCVH